MKKTPLLNIELSELIASLGHKDMVVIGDAGLPTPPSTRRIDLALTKGVPGFVETLRTILSEMQVESIILAEETGEASPQVLEVVRTLLPDAPLETVSHERLKEISASACAVVRTGEFTPYSNIILIAGVAFS